VRCGETTVVEELAIEPEDLEVARAAVTAQRNLLAQQGISATGLLLHSVGDHAAAGRVLAGHAADVDARVVAVGSSPRGAAAQFADGSLTTALTRGAHCRVVLLRRDEPSLELTDEGLGELAAAGA